jgi:TldD protein
MEFMDAGQARRILEALLSRGGEFGEIYCQSNLYTRITLDDGRLEEILSGEDAGVALRLVAGDRTFFYTGNLLDPDALHGEASRLARAMETEGAPGGVAPFRQMEIPRVSEMRIPPGGVEMGEKVGLLRRAEKVARESDPRVTQFSASYGDSTLSIAVINSDGTWAQETRVYTTLFGSVIAREGDQIRTGYHSLAETRGFELFEEHPPEEVGREAARIALVQLAALPAPAGTFTVVLSSKAGGTMIHEACGHGLEGDFAEKSLSIYAGKLGQRVASDLITVVDDGTLPNKRGSSGMDDEGTPSSRVLLIDRGILKSYLHSRRTARKLGHAPTGNGRRESYRFQPIPRMRNTLILPGATPPEEILAGVKEGIFVCQMGGGEVDIASGNFIFNVGEAYMIRDGRLAEPIRDATLIGNGPEVLGGIDAVGSDLGFGVGTCGKDGQRVPVADAQPTLRIPRIVIGGTVAPPD